MCTEEKLQEICKLMNQNHESISMLTYSHKQILTSISCPPQIAVRIQYLVLCAFQEDIPNMFEQLKPITLKFKKLWGGVYILNKFAEFDYFSFQKCRFNVMNQYIGMYDIFSEGNELKCEKFDYATSKLYKWLKNFTIIYKKIQTLYMDLNLKYQRDLSHRWGVNSGEQDMSLLAKKDQQIKRLQTELENEKKRADNAIKMLQSYKGVKRMDEQSNESLHTEVTKRMSAQQQCTLLKIENEKLKNSIRQYLKRLKNHEDDIENQ